VLEGGALLSPCSLSEIKEPSVKGKAIQEITGRRVGRKKGCGGVGGGVGEG